MNRKEPIVDNQFYHIYNRGNRRQGVFRERNDYLFFLQRTREYSLRHQVSIHAYCLMPNHYHFVLLQKSGGSIPRFMARLATSVTKRFNLRYNLVGHLFQGVYKSKRIASAGDLVHLSIYIHANPVVAGLVKAPQDWAYSNYRRSFYELSSEDEKDFTDPTPILCQFKNRKEYVEHVQEYLRSDEVNLRPRHTLEEG